MLPILHVEYSPEDFVLSKHPSFLFLCGIVLYCGRVSAANAPGCTAAEGLLYKPWSLVVPTCTARCLHQRPYSGEKWPMNFATFRDLLHAVNLRHGTNGSTSLPKEGELRIFSPANLGTKGQHATSRPPKPIGIKGKPCTVFKKVKLMVKIQLQHF